MKNILFIYLVLCGLLFPASMHSMVSYGDTNVINIKKTKRLPVKVVETNYTDKDCSKMELVVVIIDEAISVGAPTYNEGNHAGCYKIYEGAAYKILYKYGKKCKETAEILENALEKASGDYSVTEKAWIMRMAFDKILGVPTQTK